MARQEGIEPLIDNRTFFEPRRESLEDIVICTQPKGKAVLAVAGYGYPLVFLAEGAENVLSFDVSTGQIAWNHFLRASILAFDYEESLAFFPRLIKHKVGRYQKINDIEDDRDMDPTDQKEIEAIKKKVREFVPRKYRREAIEQMWEFRLGNHRLWDGYERIRQKIEQIYLHLRGRATYERVKEAVKNDRWKIVESELAALLEKESGRGNHFDVMYVSSIRNWVLHMMYEGNRKKFKEYDEKLGRLVDKLLIAGGIFYEVLVSARIFDNGFDDGESPGRPFPRVRISPELYPGLSIQTHRSHYSGTTLVVGKKQ